MKYLKTYESINNPIKDWIDKTLTWEEIKDYYNETHPIESLEDMFYWTDVWYFIDDDRFREDWIENEVDYYISDWSDRFNDIYDKKNYLIPYIEKMIEKKPDVLDNIKKDYDLDEELNQDEVLEILSPEKLKEIIDEYDEIDDFLKEYLDDILPQTSQEILNDYHSENELNEITFFDKNYYNIQNYIKWDNMKSEAMNNRADDYSYVLDDIEDDLYISKTLQNLLFEKDPKGTANIIVDNLKSVDLDNDLFTTYEFQKAYIDSTGLKDSSDIWKSLKQLHEDVGLNDEIIEEYDLESFREAEKFNF